MDLRVVPIRLAWLGGPSHTARMDLRQTVSVDSRRRGDSPHSLHVQCSTFWKRGSSGVSGCQGGKWWKSALSPASAVRLVAGFFGNK